MSNDTDHSQLLREALALTTEALALLDRVCARGCGNDGSRAGLCAGLAAGDEAGQGSGGQERGKGDDG